MQNKDYSYDIEITLNREFTQKSKYEKSKNGWVHFNKGLKKKVKLRKYISDRARLLSNLNKSSFKDNKEALVEEFNEEGLKGINNFIKQEVDFYKSKLYQIKQEIKNTENEKI